MDSTCRTRTLQYLAKEMEKQRILLSHKLQRKEGQWTTKQKSDLIDSLLRKYPINPTYVIKENNTCSVIDGVQRLSNIRDYLNNRFSLSKSLEPVFINEELKEISGKKFSALDEDVQEALKASELQVYELTDCTEKDVSEIFRRLNAGKALTNGQLRVTKESNALREIICSITEHPFMGKIITKAQSKKDLDKDIVREIFMLTEMSDDYDFGSFRSKDIDSFIEYYNDNIDMDKVNVLIAALDKLNEVFTNEIRIKITSIPMVCYGMYRVLKDEKNVQSYIDWLRNFIDNYDTNEEYLKYCNGSGTASSEMVKGRLNYFNNALNTM